MLGAENQLKGKRIEGLAKVQLPSPREDNLQDVGLAKDPRRWSLRSATM